jgi:hypothetical protein
MTGLFSICFLEAGSGVSALWAGSPQALFDFPRCQTLVNLSMLIIAAKSIRCSASH